MCHSGPSPSFWCEASSVAFLVSPDITQIEHVWNMVGGKLQNLSHPLQSLEVLLLKHFWECPLGFPAVLFYALHSGKIISIHVLFESGEQKDKKKSQGVTSGEKDRQLV